MKKNLRFLIALAALQFFVVSHLRADDKAADSSSSEEEVITVEEEAEPTPASKKAVDEVEDVTELEVDVDSTPEETAVATAEATVEATAEPTPEPTAEPTEAPAASEKMRDVYEQGIDLYKRKRYAQALEKLDKACSFKRGSAQAWLFAEAHAMRGIIYQYYMKKSKDHVEKAREAYSTALEWDRLNKTAKRHIRQVR